jgi:hypothetical protein
MKLSTGTMIDKTSLSHHDAIMHFCPTSEFVDFIDAPDSVLVSMTTVMGIASVMGTSETAMGTDDGERPIAVGDRSL